MPRVMMMQRALLQAGFNPGPIDGIIGSKTKAAIRRYQKAHGLATGAITLETLRSLGIYR
jgi:peptidoglycan hydrolase-like protein with peptidoglycan-binding domain